MSESYSASIGGLITEFLEACQVAVIYIDANFWAAPITAYTEYLYGVQAEVC